MTNPDSLDAQRDLDIIAGSSSSDGQPSPGTNSDAGDNSGGIFSSRFYGDNLDSIIGSQSSEDLVFTGPNWYDDDMSYPSTPLTNITIPNTPDTVGEYPNVVVKKARTEGLPPNQQSPHRVLEHFPIQHSVCERKTQQICFQVANFPTDGQFEHMYPHPQEIPRLFATMVRDLQVVTNHHMLCIGHAGVTSMPHTFSPSKQPLLQRQSITDSMKDVINHLCCLKDIMVTNLVGYEGESERTMTNEVLLQTDTSPWVHWPLNMQGVFLSKLVSSYMEMKPSLSFEQIEIADYCIARDDLMEPREVIFNDGDKVKVIRGQMVSMEQGEICNPVILTAWGRILNGRRKGCGQPMVACLDIVDKGMLEAGDDGIVEHWEDWQKSTIIDFQNAELVFIPMRMRNHYTLLAINFNANTIQSIDGVSHSDQPAWDLMAHSVVAKFGSLLDRLKHSRSNDLHQFKYELVNPKWSTKDETPDSAIEVMHLMDAYDGKASSILNMLLDEDHVRVALKISYVADIVLSEVSLSQHIVLGKLPRFIQHKCNGVLRPTREVVQYRQVCGWLADV